MDEQRGGWEQGHWADPARPGGGASHPGPDYTSPGPYPNQPPTFGAAGGAAAPGSGSGNPTNSPWTFGTPAEPTAPGAPGGPSGRKTGRVGRRVGFAVITAAALAVGVAGVAAAVDPGSTPTPSTTTPAPGTGNQGGDGPHGFMHRGRGMMGPSIHGQFVVPKSGGGYQTMDQQRGQVTAVSSESLTVKSEDNFSKTYAVTSTTVVTSTRNGIADVKVGDQVGVLAVEENGGVTAVHIHDITQVGVERHKYGPAPQPSSSGSTEPSRMFGGAMHI